MLCSAKKGWAVQPREDVEGPGRHAPRRRRYVPCDSNHAAFWRPRGDQGRGGVKGGADGAPRVFRAETPCCLISQGTEGRGPHTSVQTLKTHGGPRGRRRTWLNGTSTGAASSTAADVLKAFKLLKNLNDRLKQTPHQTRPPCPRAAAWAGPAPPTRQTAVRNRTELEFASRCLHGHETEGVSIKRVCEETAWPFSYLSPLPA